MNCLSLSADLFQSSANGPLLAFMGIGPTEMIIVGIVAVLLFGKRLPEVGRSLGKGLMEFKKGVRGIEEEIYGATNATPSRGASSSRGSGSASSSARPATSRYNEIDDRDEATAPKFEPPAAAPHEVAASSVPSSNVTDGPADSPSSPAAS